MKSIRQTADSLIIDTPQFTVTIPGVWRQEERPAENTVYCGRSEDGPIHKQFIVAGYLLIPGQSDTERRVAFEYLLRTRRELEEEVTSGKAKVIELPIRESGELLTGGYFAIHPSAGRVVISGALSDTEKTFNFYYELWGFSAPPDVKKLLQDFEDIMETVQLK